MTEVNIVAFMTTLSETLPSAQSLFRRMKHENGQVRHIKQKTYVGPGVPLRYEIYDYYKMGRSER